jgi:hypothetical protein
MNGRRVYRTKSGRKYHRSGCDYLWKQTRRINSSEAALQGLGPCRLCNPRGTIFYRIRTGRKYHTANCDCINRPSFPLSMGQAAALGLTPCVRF